MKNINRIVYDWFFTNETGEEFQEAKIGEQHRKKGVVSRIEYHHARGEGDRHYADIIFTTSKCIKVFNINEIEGEISE